MRYLKYWLCMAALALLATPAMAVDLVDPPWDISVGSYTYQAWDFDVDWIYPVVSNNPYGESYLIVEGCDQQLVELWDGSEGWTWHVGPEGSIQIWVWNDPRPNEVKKILLQVTADKAPGPAGPTTSPPGTTSYPYPHAGLGGNWYDYIFQIDIPSNPEWELISLDFPESTNIEEIVVDTTCTPEPTTVVLVGFGLVSLAIRRMRREK